MLGEVEGRGWGLAVVRDLREHRAPATEEEIAEFETAPITCGDERDTTTHSG
jgi:hypothetical protein